MYTCMRSSGHAVGAQSPSCVLVEYDKASNVLAPKAFPNQVCAYVVPRERPFQVNMSTSVCAVIANSDTIAYWYFY